jgi:ATP-dependent RNA helicase RhlB
VLELAYEHMNEPEKVVVETESVTTSRVRQVMYLPANEEKLPLLIGLLSRSEGARTMVFVNTKVWVERVARALEKAHYRVGVLSGDVPQKKRQSLLGKFQKGELEILVATDVAARGLHIDGVSHVFNFDLPFEAEDYVHRIGRTARLGAQGDAISFACERYAQGLPAIEAYIEQSIPVEPMTNEMLTAIPRAPRAPLLGEDGQPAESISDIFREARAEAEASGRGRGGPGGGRREGGSRSSGGPRREGGGRSGPGGRGGSASGERPARAPQAAPRAEPPAQELPKAAAPAAANAEGGGEAKRPRRRRRGPRREGGEAVAAVAQGESGKTTARLPVPPSAPASPTVSKESFFKRFTRSVRSLVAPSSKN